MRRGADALLDAIEQLQGAPLTASVLERSSFRRASPTISRPMLDALMAAGEVCG
jgi:ATP-dependent Lhr-like helicase